MSEKINHLISILLTQSRGTPRPPRYRIRPGRTLQSRKQRGFAGSEGWKKKDTTIQMKITFPDETNYKASELTLSQK